MRDFEIKMQSLRGTWVIASVLALVACVASCACILCACSTAAEPSASSPQLKLDACDISSSSQLNEESQLVDATIAFSSAVHIDGDVSQDFEVTLDGKEIDMDTVVMNFETDESGALHVKLTPTEEASQGDPQIYFACYQGSFEIKPLTSNGALAHVLGEDGACAVMNKAYSCIIPSGVQIKQISSKASTAEKAAVTKIKVTQSAQIRCCTWIKVGAKRVYMHNHTFSRESTITCAIAIAEAIANSSGGAYKAVTKSDTVTVTAQDKGAAPFDVSIDEGVVTDAE